MVRLCIFNDTETTGNYTLSLHDALPILSRLALTTHSGPLPGATVRLGVRDAEGPIGTPVELTVDLEAGRTTVLSDLGLVLDPAAMQQVGRQRPGSVEIEDRQSVV